jgi:hypothetical protein
MERAVVVTHGQGFAVRREDRSGDVLLAAQDLRGDVDDQTTLGWIELRQIGFRLGCYRGCGWVELLQGRRQKLFDMGGIGGVGEGQQLAVRAEQIIALRGNPPGLGQLV